VGGVLPALGRNEKLCGGGVGGGGGGENTEVGGGRHRGPPGHPFGFFTSLGPFVTEADTLLSVLEGACTVVRCR